MCDSPREVDIAIIGGNVMGLMTALFCQKHCPPRTSIVVIEKQSGIVSKEGESGLSSLSHAMQDIGCSLQAQARMFALKAGLAFYATDDQKIHAEINNLDYSFQFDRRALGIFLGVLCQRRGIEIKLGCQALSSVHQTGFTNNRANVTCKYRDKKEEPLTARVVVDASGKAVCLGDKQRFPHFNCNTVWTYYQAEKSLPDTIYQRFEQPTTKHFVFREGWVWIIRLIDWNKTPTNTMEQYAHHIFNQQDHGLPQLSLEEAKVAFNLDFEYQYSVGFVIRSDLDNTTQMGARKRYYEWLKRIPEVGRAFQSYKLVGEGKFYALSNIAFYNSKPYGNGYLSVGDAIAFTNPFISRGMNVGVLSAYRAAIAIKDGLQNNSMNFLTDPTPEQSAYITHVKAIVPVLGQDYRAFHESFRSPSLFRLFICTYFAVAASSNLTAYKSPGPYKAEFNFGLLEPETLEYFQKVADLLSGVNKEACIPDPVIREIERIRLKYLETGEAKNGKQRYDLFLPGCGVDLSFAGLDEYYCRIKSDGPNTTWICKIQQCKICSNFATMEETSCPSCGSNNLQQSHVNTNSI